MRKMLMCLLLGFIGILSLNAQNTWIVNQNHPDASDAKAKATMNSPFKTISKAASLAEPEDTVLVFAGVYRERVAPARGGRKDQYIVYRAAGHEKVVIKGSEIWPNEWKGYKNSGKIFYSPIPLDKLKDYNPFYVSLARMKNSRASLGQIFIDGEEYMQVDSLEELVRMPGTWMMSYDSTEIMVHYPEKYRNKSFYETCIEYSVRDKVFAPHKRGLGYIHVEGFIIEHCANQFPSGFYRKAGHPQAGALSTRAGHHWIIRKNIIRRAKNLGIDCGYEGRRDLEGTRPLPPLESIGYHLIEHNTLEENGNGGIHGAHQRETVIRNNRFYGNGHLGVPAPENGCIKVHFFYDGLIENNTFLDNPTLGIWLDNEWYRTRVTRNLILNSGSYGIFVEMGNGECLVDNNVIAYSQNSEGIYLHDASGVTIANNLLYANGHFGVYARIVTERKTTNEYTGEKELVATKNLKIYNNIFVDNYRGHICLPPEDGDRVKNNHSDYNLFINGTRWQWEGLGFNSFTMGSNDKRISKDEMIKIFQESLDEHNAPDSIRPNMSLWKNQPLLTLQQWRLVYGNDLNSRAPEVHTGNVENGAIEKGDMNFFPTRYTFRLNNGRIFNASKVPRIKGVDQDYYGNPVAEDFVYPGPFQYYKDGLNVFKLKNN